MRFGLWCSELLRQELKISSIIRITSSTTATSCVYTQQPTNNHFFQQMLLRLAQTLVNSTVLPLAFICVYFRFCFLLFVFTTACFSCVLSARNKVYDDDDDNDDKSVQQPLMVSNSNLPFPLPSLPTPNQLPGLGESCKLPQQSPGAQPLLQTHVWYFDPRKWIRWQSPAFDGYSSAYPRKDGSDWVDLVGWLHTMTFGPSKGGHPSRH